MTAYKAFFATTALCSGLALAALVSPAMAQGTGANGQPAQSSQPGQPGAAPAKQQTQQQASGEGVSSTSELVVTGSRIKTTTFNSPAPLTTITAEQAQLTGNVDTTQILQLSPVAANAVQINNFFTGFVTTGGPGVNTLSLRGLGTDRTLILLNGERLGPAGVSGTVASVDLNVLPASMIDHIEILKDGASSDLRIGRRGRRGEHHHQDQPRRRRPPRSTPTPRKPAAATATRATSAGEKPSPVATCRPASTTTGRTRCG